MATADEYAAWIVKNADKKGTPDFDTVAKAYADAKANASPAANAPNTISRSDYLAQVEARKKEGPGFFEKGGTMQSLAGGLVRGFGSIGASAAYPIDKVGDFIDNGGFGDKVSRTSITDLVTGAAPKLTRNEQRRADMDTALGTIGANTGSTSFKVGKLAGEIAGTAGAGGVVANGVARFAPAAVTAAPRAAQFLEAVKSGGFTLGSPAAITFAGKAADLGIRAAGGAVSGGAQAGMIDPSEAGTGALIGGAFPVASKVIGATAKATGSALRGSPVSPEVSALADRAKQLGIDIPADRLVNSRPLNALASSLNYVPFSGRAATEDAMSSQLNKALSNTFGQDSSNVTQALRRASSDLGGQFDTVLQNNTVKMTPTFKAALQQAEDQATSELGADGASIIHKQIALIQSKAALTGEIDGQAAYNIKKALDRIGKGNRPESFYAQDLKKSLMNALNDSLGPQEAASFATLRKQYGNMLSLENMAKNGAEGEISVARLGNMGNIHNPDMQELADIAAQFVKQRESQHGAMQRVVLGTGGTIAGLAGGGMLAGGLGLAGAAAAGRGANSLLNSNMLRQAVLAQPSAAAGNGLSKLLRNSTRVAIPASLDQ